MGYTQATVIISAADQSAAQADFPGSFTSGFVDLADAVFYVCSGLWADDDLDMIVNTVTWSHVVKFGMDAYAVLAEMNLKPVEQPPASA